jgi:hypothetical protein
LEMVGIIKFVDCWLVYSVRCIGYRCVNQKSFEDH